MAASVAAVGATEMLDLLDWKPSVFALSADVRATAHPEQTRSAK